MSDHGSSQDSCNVDLYPPLEVSVGLSRTVLFGVLVLSRNILFGVFQKCPLWGFGAFQVSPLWGLELYRSLVLEFCCSPGVWGFGEQLLHGWPGSEERSAQGFPGFPPRPFGLAGVELSQQRLLSVNQEFLQGRLPLAPNPPCWSCGAAAELSQVGKNWLPKFGSQNLAPIPGRAESPPCPVRNSCSHSLVGNGFHSAGIPMG